MISKANERTLRSALDAIATILGKLSAEESMSVHDLRSRLEAAIAGMIAQTAEDYVWVADLFPDDRVCIYNHEGRLFRCGYEIAGDTVTPAPLPHDEVMASTVYTPVTVQQESVGDAQPLIEREFTEAANATVELRIIAPGWGSTGYYPAEVLERDGPTTFIAGLKMFWNHQTEREEIERPEGDLRNLAAELVSNAYWLPSGPVGPGLYAKAKIFEGFRGAIKDLAEHIGVSIRAMALSRQGERDGRKGWIVERFLRGKSVDFVTLAGAGGKIIEMFEAARGGTQRRESDMAMTDSELQQLREAQTQAAAARAEVAALRETLRRDSARAAARQQLAEVQIAEAVRTRVIETAVATLPLTAAGELDYTALAARVTTALDTERTYLESIGVGGVRNNGSSSNAQPAELTEAQINEQLTAVMTGFGVDANVAAIAARGRF